MKLENDFLREQLAKAGIEVEIPVNLSAQAGEGQLRAPTRSEQAQQGGAVASNSKMPPGLPGQAPEAPAQSDGVDGEHRMVDEYKQEVERLKKEVAQVRAARSVAERSYRAVMAENERLCNKLEHLEEIFVQSKQHDGNASVLNEERERELRDEVRRLKSEKGQLQVLLKKAQVASASASQQGSYERQ